METQEAPRKKYKKHKKDIKITIKHYINERVKVLDSNGIERHPLYVQITVQRKTTSYRSKLEIYGNKHSMYLIGDEYGRALEREIHNIKYFIEKFDPVNNPEFSLSQVMAMYRNEPSLVDFVNKCLIRELTVAIHKEQPTFEGVLPSYVLLNEVPALVLYDKYQYLESVAEVKERYSTKIWWLSFYYQTFYSVLHTRLDAKQYIYHLIEPTVTDYIEGDFKKELYDFFIDSKDSINQLVKSIDVLIEKFYY